LRAPRESIGRKDIIYAIIGGVFFSASQPPHQTAFLAWFCLVPLFLAMSGKSYRGAFALGYLWGVTSNLISLYWIAVPTLPGMIAAIIIASLYTALFAMAFSFVERRNYTVALAVSPVIWVGMEFLRGFGQLGFPWMDLGYSQGIYRVIIQIADLVGHRGISFWLVSINALFVAFIIAKKRRWIYPVSIAVLFAIVLIYGLWRLSQPPPPETIRIALVQSNITAEDKWEKDFRRKSIDYYIEMAREIDEPIDLLVLSETATAHYHRDNPHIVDKLAELSMLVNAPILSGTLDYDPADRRRLYYNSSGLFTADGVRGVYNKINLVPGSEHVPFQNYFPALRKLDLGGSHFAMGDSIVVFEVDGMRFSAPICYEILFGCTVRRYAAGGADFITNITNDGWFGATPGPYQHANFTRFRAVENRFGVGRSAQTGISLICDETGRITKQLALNSKGILIGDVPVRTRKTLFTKLGDWIGYGSFFASPLILILTGLLLKK
jgi:apolipoprotein N-acyltransferase